ncbi:MAG: hypothetical protein AAF416_18680 [Pseudomonadota bacterium]
MRILIGSILAAVLGAAVAGGPALACSGSERCEVPEGYYLVAEPAGWDGKSPLGLVVYFHGWNGSPEGALRNRAMVNAVTGRGALFVVPWAQTGYWRQMGADRAERGRDERAYVRAVMADVTRRWPIDPARTLASGFSRGASMVWNIACYEGALFAGYAPIAGGFWNSDPKDCPSGPVNLRHIHGLADRVVAFDERGIYNSMPIASGLAVLRDAAEAGSGDAVRSGDERLTCKRWTGRSALELCTHLKGHSIPAEWVGHGFDWLLGLPPRAG